MRALVTGAGGFVGRHLTAALLAEGWSVAALCHHAEDRARLPAACRVYVGSILEQATFTALLSSQAFDVIFHLAGLNPSGARADLYRINVLGTATLLEGVRTHCRPEHKVVLLGSSSQYGESRDNPITETSVMDPVSDYGVSKTCSDLMGLAAFRETGQHILRARAFNIVGPGQGTTSLQGRVVEQIVAIERGSLPPVVKTGSLHAYRDFIDVRDVAAGLLAIARDGRAGEAYNLCSGRATLTRSVVEDLLALSTVPLELDCGARQSAGIDVSYQRGSFDKLRNLAGWSPIWSIEQSLRDGLEQGRRDGGLAPDGAIPGILASRA